MFTKSQRNQMRTLYSHGVSQTQIARLLGCCRQTVMRVLTEPQTVFIGPVRTSRPSQRQLSLAGREEISRGLKSGESYRGIARRIG